MTARKYRIVFAENIIHMEGEVNEAIAKGWVCQGGLFKERNGRYTRYYQAMIRKERADD